MNDDFNLWVRMMTQAPKMLAVEDDQTFAEMLKIASRKRHVDMTIVERAADALRRLQSEKFNLILLDQKLQGGMSGTALLKEIKNIGIKTPIVFLSGFINTEMIEEARRLGLVAFVAKPNHNPIDELSELFDLLGIRETFVSNTANA